MKGRRRLDGIGIRRCGNRGLGWYLLGAFLGFMARLATSEARTDLTTIKNGTRVPSDNNPGRDSSLDLYLHMASARVKTHVALRSNVGSLTKFGQGGLDLTLWNTVR